MIIQPLSRATRRMSSTVRQLPPPYGGWNARDNVTDMKPEDAVVLDNIIPGDNAVETRNGYEDWCTGLPSTIQALMEYSAIDGTNTLFAATATAIYNASSQGAVGAASLSSLTNGRWQNVMFSTSGGNFLCAVNGADGLRTYDGAAWATQSLTGVTASTLVNITSHIQRLWFAQTGTLKAWYLGVSSIAGAATSIDLGPHSKLGGYLMAIASWTRDGGSGMEDLGVFLTSKGELHIFSGTDPSSADTWAKVGTFKVAEPIGRRCFIKVGGDIGILTTQGLIPLSGVLNRAESAQARVAITDKIRRAFSEAYDDAETAANWQVQEYPVGKLLIINVPTVEDTSSMQFVMNSNTGAWCRFTGINANCWALKGTDLFFGAPDGNVYRYSSTTDDGANIEGVAVHAFSKFGTDRTKYFKRIRPLIFGPTGYRPAVGLALDYSEEMSTVAAPAATTSGTEWDFGDWDTTDWAPPSRTSALWQAMRGEGFSAAVVIGVNTPEKITYNGSTLLFEVGDAL
jgi:hypothetical protein